MTQSKPSNKGASKGNTRKTVAKTASGDKYKAKAMQSWENGRKQLVSNLSANSGLPFEEKSKKPAKKRLANQQQPNDPSL